MCLVLDNNLILGWIFYIVGHRAWSLIFMFDDCFDFMIINSESTALYKSAVYKGTRLSRVISETVRNFILTLIQSSFNETQVNNSKIIFLNQTL